MTARTLLILVCAAAAGVLAASSTALAAGIPTMIAVAVALHEKVGA